MPSVCVCTCVCACVLHAWFIKLDRIIKGNISYVAERYWNSCDIKAQKRNILLEKGEKQSARKMV